MNDKFTSAEFIQAVRWLEEKVKDNPPPDTALLPFFPGLYKRPNRGWKLSNYKRYLRRHKLIQHLSKSY